MERIGMDTANKIIDFEKGISINYNDICIKSRYFANLFAQKGIKTNDKICLFSNNNILWIMFENAIHEAGGIAVLRGSDCPVSELQYIYEDSNSVAIITDSIDIVNCFQSRTDVSFILYFGESKIPKENKNVILYSDINFNENIEETKNIKSNFASILYTSGTSGKPKGVLLEHKNFEYLYNELKKCIPIEKGLTISVMPIWHSGPRLYNRYFFISGVDIIFAKFNNYFDAIQKYNPDYLHCVPRVLEVIKDKYSEIIKKQSSFYSLVFNILYKISVIYKKLFRISNYGYANTFFKPNLYNKPIEHILKYIHKISSKLIYDKLNKKVLGEKKVKLLIGGAVIPKTLLEFFDVMNIPLICGYGLTEAGPFVSHDVDGISKFYSSGKILEGTDIKILDINTQKEVQIGQKGIIYVKGPQLMNCYYNRLNDGYIDENGFFNTNDIGFLSENNYLTVLGRSDDVAVLLNGLNIELPYIEFYLKKISYINEIVVIGDSLPYLSALVEVNNNFYSDWCKNISKDINRNINNDTSFKDFVINELNDIIKKSSFYTKENKIKNIYFLDRGFSENKEFYTNTSKLKRRYIRQKFNKEIMNMYFNNPIYNNENF